MNTSNFIGYFNLSKPIDKMDNNNIEYKKELVNEKIIYLLSEVLPENNIDFMIKELFGNDSVPVGKDGIAKNYVRGSKIHSYRSTIHDVEIANNLFKIIEKILVPLKNKYRNNEIWIPCGVNPAFRFIKYADNGYLVPHYDFPYEKGVDEMSLMSLVIYLTTNSNGETQFVKEYRDNDETDWGRKADEDEILFRIKPEKGNALLFEHNMLHQSEESKSEKIIIRTDIMYKRGL